MGKRNEPIKGTVQGFVENAMSEIEELASEMIEWRDNLEESFSQTEKYEQISETADTLENVDTPDIPLAVAEVDCETTQDTRTQPTRARRLVNALLLLNAAVDAAGDRRTDIEIELQESKDGSDENEAFSDDFEMVEQFVDELEETIGELENVEFPRAFG